jgi:hypothetical protein
LILTLRREFFRIGQWLEDSSPGVGFWVAA